ncbi:hypothetical protein QBC36DRAFT_368095 [Triangularia setosa]|uniref:Uncharacterized protein n=1 Tax=Triangularia setosa TaxID=2587417 RepID=A0AAN6VWS3_9PEZI|nr:hypothetical protein QBC36DRAFT_368095 [Podospora setosa]
MKSLPFAQWHIGHPTADEVFIVGIVRDQVQPQKPKLGAVGVAERVFVFLQAPCLELADQTDIPHSESGFESQHRNHKPADLSNDRPGPVGDRLSNGGLAMVGAVIPEFCSQSQQGGESQPYARENPADSFVSSPKEERGHDESGGGEVFQPVFQLEVKSVFLNKLCEGDLCRKAVGVCDGGCLEQSKQEEHDVQPAQRSDHRKKTYGGDDAVHAVTGVLDDRISEEVQSVACLPVWAEKFPEDKLHAESAERSKDIVANGDQDSSVTDFLGLKWKLGWLGRRRWWWRTSIMIEGVEDGWRYCVPSVLKVSRSISAGEPIIISTCITEHLG